MLVNKALLAKCSLTFLIPPLISGYKVMTNVPVYEALRYARGYAGDCSASIYQCVNVHRAGGVCGVQRVHSCPYKYLAVENLTGSRGGHVVGR